MSRRFRVSRALGAWMLALPLLAGAPAQAEQQTVTGTFDVRVGPLQVGRGSFEAQLSRESYAIGVAARVTGVARLLAGGQGSASAQGAISGQSLVPELYQIGNTAGDIRNDIRLVMRANAVVSEGVQPPVIPLPDRVPMHDTHRRGVIDPLSAFIFPVAAGVDPLAPENCNRTLRVYDGRGRYDITLSFARAEEIKQRELEGQAIVCRARYTPIAGHRRASPTDRAAQDAYRDMEAWLMPVPGTRALMVARMQVGTPVGRLTVQMNRMTVSPGAATAAR